MSEFRGSVLDPTIIDEPKTQIEFSGNGGSNTPPGLPETINGSPDHPPIPESPEVIDARFGEIASDARFGAIVSRLGDVAAIMDKIASEDGDEHTIGPDQNVIDIGGKLTDRPDDTALRGVQGSITSLQDYKSKRPEIL